MVNKILDGYIEEDGLLCVKRTKDILKSIERYWNLQQEGPLDMAQVLLFLCNERSSTLTEEQKSFARAQRDQTCQEYHVNLFYDILGDEKTRKNLSDFISKYLPKIPA